MIGNVSSAFQLHYCGGDLKSITPNSLLMSTKKSCCGTMDNGVVSGINVTEKKCCQNIAIQSADIDFNQSIKILSSGETLVTPIAPSIFQSFYCQIDKFQFTGNSINSPPKILKVRPVYKQIQAFLI